MYRWKKYLWGFAVFTNEFYLEFKDFEFGNVKKKFNWKVDNPLVGLLFYMYMLVNIKM